MGRLLKQIQNAMPHRRKNIGIEAGYLFQLGPVYPYFHKRLLHNVLALAARFGHAEAVSV